MPSMGESSQARKEVKAENQECVIKTEKIDNEIEEITNEAIESHETYNNIIKEEPEDIIEICENIKTEEVFNQIEIQPPALEIQDSFSVATAEIKIEQYGTVVESNTTSIAPDNQEEDDDIPDDIG